MKMDELISDLRRFMYNEKYITARGLKIVGDNIGIDVELLSGGLGFLLALYLIIGEYAQFLANFILVVPPLLFAHVFINESPPINLIIFHFEVYGVTSLLEASIKEPMAGYYFIKVLAFATLYLKPFVFAKQIIAELKKIAWIKRVELLAKANTPSLNNELSHSVVSPPPTGGYSPETALSPSIDDAMFKDPRHILSLDSPANDFLGSDEPDPQDPELPVHLNDLVLEPKDSLIFNGPFDDHSLTYHIYMKSNSIRHIAFSIKSTAIPRLTAIPPYGILSPKQKKLIALKLQTFDYEKTDVSKDRIAFDYVFCPPETQRFSHKLFEGVETRRRKNLLIKYNP